MWTEYKRDMNHNYLILHSEKAIDTTSYQLRMLAGNVIPSILKCRIQGLDGEALFYYEITSKQSLSSLFEQKKFREEDLRLIFGGFIKIMEQMTEYLLNPGELLITPDHIYLDIEKRELFFCCLPGNEKEIQEQFRELTEYMLPKLDHEDERAVVLGYGIYRKALDERFHLESVKEELFQVRGHISAGNEGKVENGSEVNSKELSYAEISSIDCPENQKIPSEKTSQKKPFFSRKEKPRETTVKKKPSKNRWLLWICGCMVGALAIFGLLAASYMGIIPWIPVEWVILAGSFALGAGLLAGFLIEKKQNRNLQVEEWRERVRKELAESEEELFPYIENDAGEGLPQEALRERRITKQDCVKTHAADRKLSEPSGEISELHCVGRKNQELFGETVLLSSAPVKGPASLVSREPGELAPIFLENELTVIGKMPNASDVVIALPTISRVHARIRKQGEEYFLTDLNSRNGTSVNGKMLKGNEEYCLQEEDEVDFAQARYVFLK